MDPNALIETVLSALNSSLSAGLEGFAQALNTSIWSLRNEVCSLTSLTHSLTHSLAHSLTHCLSVCEKNQQISVLFTWLPK